MQSKGDLRTHSKPHQQPRELKEPEERNSKTKKTQCDAQSKSRISILLGVWLIPFTAKGSARRRGEASSHLQTQLGRFGQGARGWEISFFGRAVFFSFGLFFFIHNIFHTRMVSVTPHACASQPRCVCGASPSMISGIWPMQPVRIRPRDACK